MPWKTTLYDAATCEAPKRCRWPGCKCEGRPHPGEKPTDDGKVHLSTIQRAET